MYSGIPGRSIAAFLPRSFMASDELCAVSNSGFQLQQGPCLNICFRQPFDIFSVPHKPTADCIELSQVNSSFEYVGISADTTEADLKQLQTQMGRL